MYNKICINDIVWVVLLCYVRVRSRQNVQELTANGMGYFGGPTTIVAFEVTLGVTVDASRLREVLRIPDISKCCIADSSTHTHKLEVFYHCRSKWIGQ